MYHNSFFIYSTNPENKINTSLSRLPSCRESSSKSFNPSSLCGNYVSLRFSYTILGDWEKCLRLRDLKRAQQAAKIVITMVGYWGKRIVLRASSCSDK
ncbi:hypothetical protein CDAR_587421 [Caerostris darwini]|uniref:Uncharacterized protein n=1 Tax=Caerostris darwini TaxID=1538125 RepID=A0AAV4SJV3_9ARAC|nr:hypothetical protein CDAR_587421 [Caerostris darwini]